MASKEKLAKMGNTLTRMQKIKADTLQPHPLAQREIVPSRLRKLKDDLDLDAIGVLHCVEYPIKGKTAMWIIDGQHRWRALMDHGLGDWEVEVKIHMNVKDDARASALFLKLNDRSPVRPFDKWLNRLSAKEDVALRINDIVTKNHLQIAATIGDGKIVGISSVEKAHKLDDGEALDKTLGTIRAAWGLRAIDAKVIEGLALVFARYNGTIDQPAMLKKLSKYPGGATAVVGDARGLMKYGKGSLARCIAMVVIDTYNSGRRAERLEPL